MQALITIANQILVVFIHKALVIFDLLFKTSNKLLFLSIYVNNYYSLRSHQYYLS